MDPVFPKNFRLSTSLENFYIVSNLSYLFVTFDKDNINDVLLNLVQFSLFANNKSNASNTEEPAWHLHQEHDTSNNRIRIKFPNDISV
jgi:hypothetical protein